nr:unnamed protein product [Callosobruchus analis]
MNYFSEAEARIII